MNIKDIVELRDVWFTKTLPLLNEYLYGDWEKLMALVPNFVDKAQITDMKIREFAGDFYYWFKKDTDFASNDDFIAALTI
jgi:hypothetical protein